MGVAFYSLQFLCIFHLKFLFYLVPSDFNYIEIQYSDLVHSMALLVWIKSQSPTVWEGFDYPKVTCAAACRIQKEQIDEKKSLRHDKNLKVAKERSCRFFTDFSLRLLAPSLPSPQDYNYERQCKEVFKYYFQVLACTDVRELSGVVSTVLGMYILIFRYYFLGLAL